MERRKFTRFRPQDVAYAVLWGDANKIGKICDISINGLAFRYPKFFLKVFYALTASGGA